MQCEGHQLKTQGTPRRRKTHTLTPLDVSLYYSVEMSDMMCMYMRETSVESWSRLWLKRQLLEPH